MPTLGKAAASTALPHPPRTSQNVPIDSAASLGNIRASLRWITRQSTRRACYSRDAADFSSPMT